MENTDKLFVRTRNGVFLQYFQCRNIQHKQDKPEFTLIKVLSKT
jgi:hypothetical protein